MQEETPVEETAEQDTEQQPTQQKQQDPLPVASAQNEMNVRRMREAKEKAEKERDELFKRLETIEKRINPQQESQQDTPIPYGADDLIEGKHLSQYERKLKALEQQLQQYQKQTAETVVEAKIKAKYQDFESTVTKDNLDLLSETYPELAASMQATPDLYTKAVTAYTLIKKLGIQPEQTYNPDQARVQINATKPRPVASVAPQTGTSPLARANAFEGGLTEELKTALWKEMLEAQKRG